MDRDSGSAMLLPEAQSALHDSSRIVLSALDALPGEVCVLDSNGVVVMANKAWRVSGTEHRERDWMCARAKTSSLPAATFRKANVCTRRT